MPQSPTANMSLILPTEGGDSNVWDVILDAAFGLIDSHNHSPGRGVLVPSAGLNINADVTFGGLWAPTNVRAVDFTPVAPASVSALAGAFFVNSSDANNLYWRTPSGTNVKVIDGTTLNVVAFTGGIGGDYSSAGALVSYVATNKNYTFKGPDPGGGRRWEGLASGQVDIFEQYTTVANRVRLQSPAALAASYALTLFAALPGATSAVQVSSTGVLSASNAFTGAVSATTTVTAGTSLIATTDVKHGDMVMNVSPFICIPSANVTVAVTPTRLSWSGGSGTIDGPIPLKEGDRIKSFSYTRIGDGSVDITVAIVNLTTAAGSTSSLGSTSETNVTAAWATTTINVTDTTLGVGDTLTFQIAANAAGLGVLGFSVTYDRP